MKKRLIIKSFKTRANSNNNLSKTIVVGYNINKKNGRYIEKIGVCTKNQDEFFYFIKLSRLGFWLNRGATIKPRVSWIVGMLGKGYINKC